VRNRLLIGVAVSLAVNLVMLAGLLALAMRGDFDLQKIIPVDFIKLEVPKPPEPTPPPKPKETPTPPPKKQPEKAPEPTKAPIAEDPTATGPATIQTAPTIQDSPPPEVVNASELDSRPKVLNFVKPVYPVLALRANRKGVVRLRFMITKSGNVTNVRVLSEPPGLGFGQAAVDAVKQWKFETPRINGRPVNAWVVQAVRFQPE